MPWSAVIAGAGLAASIGGTVAGAANKPKAPKPRNLGQEASDALTAQERNFGRQSTLDRRQSFNSLGLQRELLLGGQGSGSTLWMGKDGKPLDPEWQTYLNDPLTTEEDRASYTKQYGFTATQQPGTGDPGLLATYRDVLTQYGPQFSTGIGQVDPRGAALDEQMLAQARQELTQGGGPLDKYMEQDALSQLSYGSQLDPVDLRQLQQAYRGSQGARGMGWGPGDAAQESLGVLAGGQALRQQRQAYGLNAAQNARAGRAQSQNFASAVSANRFNTRTAPVIGMLGLNSASNSAGGLQQSSQFNPFSGYAQDLNNTNFNAQAAAQIAGYNQRQNSIAGLTSSAGNLAGSYLYAQALQPKPMTATAYANDMIGRHGYGLS